MSFLDVNICFIAKQSTPISPSIWGSTAKWVGHRAVVLVGFISVLRGQREVIG